MEQEGGENTGKSHVHVGVLGGEKNGKKKVRSRNK